VYEAEITVVQHKTSKVISLKEKHQVATLSSAEGGCSRDFITSTGASRQFVPPSLVFPRKNMGPELLDGAPLATITACHSSGWIEQEIFTMWFKHFVSILKPTASDPVVLISDEHHSHALTNDIDRSRK
jgi:hypothetical protein